MSWKFRTQRPRGYLRVLGGLSFITIAATLAAGREFTPFAEIKPILDQQRDGLPSELRNANEAKWLAWTLGGTKAIRARLEQGELDPW